MQVEVGRQPKSLEELARLFIVVWSFPDCSINLSKHQMFCAHWPSDPSSLLGKLQILLQEGVQKRSVKPEIFKKIGWNLPRLPLLPLSLLHPFSRQNQLLFYVASMWLGSWALLELIVIAWRSRWGWGEPLEEAGPGSQELTYARLIY